MKTILTSLILFFSVTIFAQTQKDKIEDINLEELRKRVDSSRKASDSAFDATLKRIQDEEFERSQKQNLRNIEAFMHEQDRMNEKKNKALWIRGGFLLLGVGLMIFAFVRRKRKASNSKSKV